MAGAGVIHCRTALQSRPLQPLQHQHPQRRIQFMQQRRQGGAHDPCPDQNDVVVRIGGKGAVLLHRTQGVETALVTLWGRYVGLLC